jgi:hypothetical protein
MTSLSTSPSAIAATSPSPSGSPSELPADDERQAQSAAFALALATALDFGALAWLAAHPGLPNVLLAAALHAGAVALVMARSGPPRSQCLLAAALTLTLPLAGAPIAALMRGTDGRGAIGDTGPQDAPMAPALASPADLRRMAEGLSCCEALLVADADERRAILSTLSRRPDRNAIDLLRWALASPHPDLAVEAALALEDVGATFDATLAAQRVALEQTPTFGGAVALADVITDAAEAGVADAPLVPGLAREARQWYLRAADLDPARADVVAIGRARLELAVLRPDNALDAIDRALPTAGPAAREQLIALRQEAALASHSLPWEGPSALATYGRPMSRGVTARRHTLVPLLGTEVTRG